LALSAPPWSRELELRCDELATALETICAEIRQLMPTRSPRKPRNPSLATAIERAEKSGKQVSSVTLMPDGMKLNFGESEPGEASNSVAAR
jgi:hypothetical protein